MNSTSQKKKNPIHKIPSPPRSSEPMKDKHKERRSQLIQAATRLFYTMGYERMSVRDLEIEGKITRGGIYYYFGSKEEIYCGVVIAALERVRDDVNVVLEKYRSNPKRAIAALLQAFIYWFENERPIFDLLQRFFFGPTPGIKLDTRSLDEVNSVLLECIGAVQAMIGKGIEIGVFECSDNEFQFMVIWGLMATLPHMHEGNDRMRAVARPKVKLHRDIERFVMRSLGVK